jgi:DNA polymerase III subunit epsilon
MIFDKPILCFDLETSDADPNTCAIFEYGCVLLLPDGTRKKGSVRFKPWKPITEGATAVTGVTNEMVEKCPAFKDYAERIWKSLQGRDLAGYNLNRFDLPCLDAEIRRATDNRLKIDLTGVRVYDAQVIYFKKDPRSLSDAVRKYCGREHEGAHGAEDDADASLDVLLGQLSTYPDLDSVSLDELAKYSRMSEFEMVDLAGKLYRDAEGFCRYAFGKVKDVRVADDMGYADWMLRKGDFPASTCEALRAELKRLELL